MTLLHAHFHLRNQQAFQRLLDGSDKRPGGQSGGGSGLSTSGGRSWNRPSGLTAACEVNARDQLGRTVLHLAAASTEPWTLEFVRMLLAHPAINVNVQDTENHWTALHRALYHGNIGAARMLFQRSDTDTSLKDFEGYTAFDLYNSTLKTTKPSSQDDDQAELFTWGANRNATLGVGDGDDRLHPDETIIPKKDDPSSEKTSVDKKFSPIRVRQVGMSRLHTVVVTSERQGNIRVCGFGSVGRLGPGQHTQQYSLVPLPSFTHTIISVALGQDHTLALTSSGEVLSWGLNRFSQLGYPLDLPPTGGEPIQASPRKVIGPLRKETVVGVAACKTASACWTETEVFTWGTNGGQLGYDKSAQPVQIIPRKVTKVTRPVISVALSDFAMACLLDTKDVMCIWHDRYFKINFPAHTFPSEIHVYRPPQAVRDANIAKITSCDDMFGAVSSNGEAFIFTAPKPSELDVASGKDRIPIKPQRIWTLRKQFSSAKDMALGDDGSIIICTESGHVFVRTKTAKAAHGVVPKTFKFQRVPYVQRVTRVFANNTGAFGVLRVDYHPPGIKVPARSLEQDLAALQPFLPFSLGDSLAPSENSSPVVSSNDQASSPTEEFDDGDDAFIQKDIQSIGRLLDFIVHDKAYRKTSGGASIYEDASPAHDADVLIQVRGGPDVPAHALVLCTRSSVLFNLFGRKGELQEKAANLSIKFLPGPGRPSIRLSFSGCHPLSVLILLTYLYSDELLAVWEPRVSFALGRRLQDMQIKPAQVKDQVRALARMLELSHLAQAAESPARRVPVPSLCKDMSRVFDNSQSSERGLRHSLSPDVCLQLADREVHVHSVLLRARSPFFSAFFDDDDWTVNRRNADGTLAVDMKHLTWRVMEFVLRYLCCGEQDDLFDQLDFVHSVDELLELMFDVMAAANELLLDHLVALSSVVVLRYLNVSNACYILTDAAYFNSPLLVESVQAYIATNMELLLESRMLDDLTAALVKELCVYIHKKQVEKAPVSRSGILATKALEKHRDWVELQDFPQPIIRSNKALQSPRLSPTLGTKRARKLSLTPQNSPSIHPLSLRPSHQGDEIFEMDDAEPLPALNLEAPHSPLDTGRIESAQPTSTPTSATVWKAKKVAPRVDMKAIMEEAANSRPLSVHAAMSIPLADTGEAGMRTPTKVTRTVQRDWRKADQSSSGEERQITAARPGGSPWKLVSSPSAPIAVPGKPSPTLALAGSPSVHVLPAHSGGPSPPKLRLDGPVESRQATPQRPQPFGQPGPGLGPTFAPSRQAATKTNSSQSHAGRRVSPGTPWIVPPVQPVVESSPTTSSMSFAAIQQSQIDQGAAKPKDKRSLLEIQEEERARQAEEDFLKWWASEEERVKQEVTGPIRTQGAPKRNQRKGKAPPPKDGRKISASEGRKPGQSRRQGNQQATSTASKI